MIEPIILASQSPRRKELLAMADIPFEVVVSNTDESFPPGSSFSDAAVHIALQKALAVQQNVGAAKTILAADTVVVCDHELIGKPKDEADAVRMLTKLSGQTHEVITGVAILFAAGGSTKFADSTLVTFNALNGRDVEYYVRRYKPFDKAGAYGIQEWIGAVAIKRIEGDFYNVMGLPVNRVYELLSLRDNGIRG